MGNSGHWAIALGAAKLKDVCESAGFSRVYAILDAKQRQLLQRWMDSLLVNPTLKDLANQVIKEGAYLSEYGRIWRVRPAAERKAKRLLNDLIPAGKRDDRVQIDPKDLIDAKAFDVTTDNADEAVFMDEMRERLEKRGVWLRFATTWRRLEEDRSRLVPDLRRFEVWLSLGADGDQIPTQGGRIDRKALLATTELGAAYYRAVHDGPVQRKLSAETKRLSSAIDDGMALHGMMSQIRSDAAPGVVGISDFLGGADFPELQDWVEANKLLVRAMEFNNKGMTNASRGMLVVAALSVRIAAGRLNGYIDDTTSGAELAVKGLKVAQTAGEVAEVGLTIVTVAGAAKFVATGTVRVGSRITVQSGRAAIEAEIQAAQQTTKTLQGGADKYLEWYRKSGGAGGTAQELEEINKLNRARSAAQVGKPKVIAKAKI